MFITKKFGFSLIETIIYIALFGLIMTSALVTAYQLIVSSNEINYRTLIDEEASFLLAKIDWALTGAPTAQVHLPNSQELNTPRGNFNLNPATHALEFNQQALNADTVVVENLVFEKISTNGQILVQTSFELNGRPYLVTKYLRQ